MKKVFIFIAMMVVVAVSASAQILSCNLGESTDVVNKKLLSKGFYLGHSTDTEAEYISQVPVETEDGLFVDRAHLGFKDGKLCCINVDLPGILSPVLIAVSYAKYLNADVDYPSIKDLERLEGQVRKWRELENTLIIGRNPRWTGYELFLINNSTRGLAHAEMYFRNGNYLVGFEWYDDSITLSWGTADFFGVN
jgi:hypothetical protein